MESAHILLVESNVLLDQALVGRAKRARTLEERIVYVGNVLHVPHGEALELKIAMNDVEEGVRARMPQVGRVVWGDATHVHADGMRRSHELELAPRKRVEYLHCHPFLPLII